MSIKYIFCINTGRNGSKYLTELLSKAKNTVSLHEEKPMMNGSPMQKFNEGDEQALANLIPLKMKEISKANQNGRKIYCETNHSFIKGWGYLLPDQYIPQEEIGVIILRRDIDKIAYSFLRIHTVPNSSDWARTWLLTPNTKRNLSQPHNDANLYELCQWYAKETYLRAEEYKRLFPKIKYVECNLEQLNQYNFVQDMFAYFSLIPLDSLQNTVGKMINSKNYWPKLPLEKLLSLSKYPSADSFKSQERDTLVKQMVKYLQEEKPDQISQIKPDYTKGGTCAGGVSRLVIDLEQELEAMFECSLLATDTERNLTWELLHTINPNDVAFICRQRSLNPPIHYTYDFNQIINLKTMITKLGLPAALRIKSSGFHKLMTTN